MFIGFVMFYLGLLLPICYLAGFTGTAILTQWVVLSLILPLALWKKGPFTFLHGAGFVFLAYATLSLWWVPNINDSLLGLWHLYIFALALWLGTILPRSSLTQLWRGLALGLSISSLFAIGQVLGFETVYRNIGPIPGYAGLLFNSTVQGAAIALVILGLITERLWLYIPMLLPGLYLAHSRGGYLILTVGLLARYVHWTVALLILTCGGLLAIYFADSSNALRLQIWGVAYASLTNRGYGIGSFYDIWYQSAGTLIHPEFVHNDYLQLIFEFGWGAIIPFGIFSAGLFHTRSGVWPVAVGFATCMAFYFPLSCPLIAFIGAVVTGHLLREPNELWASWRSGGPWLIYLNTLWQSGYGPYHGPSLPIPSRTQNQE